MAVKTLSHEKMKEIDKFMQEVDLMKKFSHPNIVSLLGELTCSLRFLHVQCVCVLEGCVCSKILQFIANTTYLLHPFVHKVQLVPGHHIL